MKEVAIDPARERAEYVANDLHGAVQIALDELGTDIAGYALVAWDMRGNCQTAYNSNYGPIGACLVPHYAGQALNRHVAVVLANPDAGTIVPTGA